MLYLDLDTNREGSYWQSRINNFIPEGQSHRRKHRAILYSRNQFYSLSHRVGRGGGESDWWMSGQGGSRVISVRRGNDLTAT